MGSATRLAPPKPSAADGHVRGHDGGTAKEIIRLRWHDLDFASETAVLRGMKRAKGERTTRRVALAEPLVRRLRAWQETSSGRLSVFPDGPADAAFGANDTHDLFRRAVTRTKWQHLRG